MMNRKEFLIMLEKEFTMDDYIALKEEEAKQEGKQEGAYEKLVDMVTNLYKSNVSLDIIAQSARITKKEVLDIINGHEVKQF